MRRSVGVALGLCLTLLPGCSRPARSVGSGSTTTATSPADVSPASTTTSTTSTTSTTVAPTTTVPPPPPEDPAWTVESETSSAIVVDVRTVVGADGSHVSLARFRGDTVRLALHAGSTDPPTAGVTLAPDGQNLVSPAERPVLLGAFNGGFKTSSGSGGVEIGGQVLKTILPGAASTVIDANGTASIGLWGRDVPRAGSQVVSVRQNLGLLVDGGQVSPAIGVISAWGATLGGGTTVARSALGEDVSGNLVYAGSMSARPTDLANALVIAGATTAMELDINPNWVQLDLASVPGGPLLTSVPGQNRPAGQFLTGWTRDFFTVLSAPVVPPFEPHGGR